MVPVAVVGVGSLFPGSDGNTGNAGQADYAMGDGAPVAEMRDVEQTRVPEPGETEGLP